MKVSEISEMHCIVHRKIITQDIISLSIITQTIISTTSAADCKNMADCKRQTVNPEFRTGIPNRDNDRLPPGLLVPYVPYVPYKKIKL